MTTPQRDRAVVFNGAIYNFRELRQELEQRGYSFRTQTDTEVLLHGYDAWGIDGLVERLRGMFAFAIWDDARRRLFLVRDRLGVKPVYYVRMENGDIAFASTVGALAAAGLAGSLCDRAVLQLLDNGYLGPDASIYRDVLKLEPASILEYSHGSIRVRQYWKLPDREEDSSMSFDAAVSKTRELLLEAVDVRMSADVPVAALLSGGVDSALVCWALSQLGAEITAYTVGTPGHAIDETAAAVATAKRLRIPHVVLTMEGELDDTLDELMRAYPEPLACPSALGMLAVSRAVRQHAKVLLTGDGGDDLFLGYRQHRFLRASQTIAQHLPDNASRAWDRFRAHVPSRGPIGRIRNLADYTAGGLPAFLAVGERFPRVTLGPRLSAVANATGPSDEWSLASARRGLDEYLAHDRRNQFVGEYLSKIDGTTMHHGLEARSPFLDQKLWQSAAAFPYHVHLRHGRLKAVLRAIAGDQIGRGVASRRKRGFSIPVQHWLPRRWYPLAEQAFADSFLEREGYLAPRTLLPALQQARSAGSAPLSLWHAFVLEKWARATPSAEAGRIGRETRSA